MIDPKTLAGALLQQKEEQLAATPLPQNSAITIQNVVDGTMYYFDSTKLDPTHPQHIALMGLLTHLDANGPMTADEIFDWMLATYSKEFSLENILMGLQVDELLLENHPNNVIPTVYPIDLTVPTVIQQRREEALAAKKKIVVTQSGSFTCNGTLAPMCPVCRSMEQREFTSSAIPYELSLKDIEEYVPVEEVTFYAVSTCNCSEDITWKITVTPDPAGGMSTILFEQEYGDRLSRTHRHAGAMSHLPNYR